MKTYGKRIVKVNDEKHSSKRFNFLTLIKEDDELAFSNMFHHFSSSIPIYLSFCKRVFRSRSSSEYKIVREFHQIDLWVEDQNQVLVIENKIKSGLTAFPNVMTLVKRFGPITVIKVLCLC